MDAEPVIQAGKIIDQAFVGNVTIARAHDPAVKQNSGGRDQDRQKDCCPPIFHFDLRLRNDPGRQPKLPPVRFTG
jgi:hypothetical protein